MPGDYMHTDVRGDGRSGRFLDQQARGRALMEGEYAVGRPDRPSEFGAGALGSEEAASGYELRGDRRKAMANLRGRQR